VERKRGSAGPEGFREAELSECKLDFGLQEAGRAGSIETFPFELDTAAAR